MNPLLNRIYQNKNKNKSKSKYTQANVNSSNPKDRVSSLDKVLVPKLNMKVKLQAIGDLPNEKLKTALIKPYIGKIPTFQTQKKIQPKSRGQFRSRRLSSTIKQQDHSLYFPTELNFDIDHKKTLAEQNQKEKIFETKQKNQTFVTEQKKFHKIEQDQQQKNRKQNELFEYLNVLETNPDLNQEFCYMNRDQKPYSFYIVDYQDRNRQEYLTVSLRGITYFKEQDDQFFTIQQFSKDVNKYRQISKIGFFDNYIKQKVMNHWKIAMVQRKFLSKCQFLRSHLMSQNDIMQYYIKFLHNIYVDFVKGNFIGFKISNTSQGLEQLILHMEQKQKNIGDQFKFLQKQIKIQLLQTNTKSMTVFRRQQRITLGTNDKLQKDQSFLPYDNKKKSMKFTQLAKLKEYQEKLYHLIKYTDLVRFNLKIQHVINTLTQGINQMNSMYNKYLNRSKMTFISWIECKINIVAPQAINIMASVMRKKSQTPSLSLSQISQKRKIQLIPSISSIKQIFIEHKKKCLQLVYRNHELLITKKDDFLCTQFDFLSEIPSDLDLKLIIQKQLSIALLRVQFIKSLDKILKEVQNYVTKMQETLLRIYNESFMQKQIEYYLVNQTLREYLTNYESQKQLIQSCEEIIEYGLVVLRVQQFKFEVRRKYEQKYKAIITAIPAQVNKRCEKLSKDVRQIYAQFKQNPQTVRQYLNFSKKFFQQKGKLFLIQKRIEQLLELQQMVHKNGIKLVESSKMHISQCQTFYRELQKRFLQIQQNQDKNKKHFQILIDSIIPKIQEKAEDVLKDIQTSSVITNPFSQQLVVQKKLQQFQEDYNKLKTKKQELFQYQDQMNLGHKDLQNYFKLQIKLDWFLKLWRKKKELAEFQQIVKEKGYAQINDLSIAPLNQFQLDLDAAAMDIQAVQLLQEFKSQLSRTLYIIKLAKLMGTQTFQSQHFDQIKKLIVTNSKKIKSILFTIQGGKTITCQQIFQNSNIKQIQNEIAQIAFLSAQESIIKKQLNEIQEYWRKNKIKFISLDIIGNGTQTLHLDENQSLHEKLGLFLLTLRSIQGSSHATGQVLQKLQIQKKVTLYLQKLLLKWSDVQKEWLKLLPLMTNSPSVKHQSNVYFQFTGVDNSMKKLIKQINDMSSMRKVIEDYQEMKFILTLQKCGRQLKDINKVLLQFLQTKRATYNRFFFLTDEQLITIIQNVKDARSFSNYAGLCFNCIKVTLQNQLISGFQNTHEIYKLRKAILRGQPDEMFKSISQNMKTSMKYAVRALIPKMKIATNIEQELKQNCLQVCILSDSIIWTQMSETYLKVTSYDQFQLLIKGPYEQMSRLLPKIGKQYWLKLTIRLMNSMHLKDIGEQMIRDQVTKNDFKWKQQIKYSLQQDQITIRQFDKKQIHGLQYYPPQKIIVPTLNTSRFIYEAYYANSINKIMLINGTEGLGKRNLVKYGAMRFGTYHKQLVCNSNLSSQYILRFVQGALLAGAWLSFYEYSNLKPSVTYQLLENIQNFRQSEKLHIRTMFVFVNHGFQVQKISMFKFNNYAVVEPEHKKICQYLLQMYKFKEWQELTKKIIGFLKTIKPFLQKVMGSQMSLIRRIVDGAGIKKINGKIGQNQNLIVVQTIRKQIIDKSSEQISTIFAKALSSYFNVDEILVDQNKKYNEKLQILKYLLNQDDVKNLVVIGQRSCKSTLIQEALRALGKKSAKIYPQASQQFFNQYSIQYLNSLQNNQILIYDGNNIISEFNDLITSDYLLIADRKVIIKQKVIMEMRSIQQCSPSFIQKCQIVYLGNLVTKLSLFMKFCPLQNILENELYLIMSQLFGTQFQKLETGLVQIIAKFINRYKNISQSKTLHKLLVWFMTVLVDQNLWQRHYSGKFTDYTVHNQYLELVPIDTNKLSPEKFNNTKFLITPTKSSIMISQLSLCLMQMNLQILLYGGAQIGKTSLLSLIKGLKINLSVYKNSSYWTQTFKKKLICVRKQAKNYLMSINQTSYRVIVDDLDLGTTHHCEYLRYLIDCHQIRDSKYIEYFPNNFEVLCTSRKSKFNNKLFDRMVKIPLQVMSKESISTIFHTNIQNFVKSNGTNKQVQEFLERTVLKSFLIVYDDLQKVFSANMAGQQVLTILRNIISVPKKNSFISVQDFESLFKFMFYNKLTEKSFNKKMKWQLNFFYQNIAKVCFNNKIQRELWINDEKVYKQISQQKIIKLITEKFSHLIVFQSMIQNILTMNNQLHCLYSHIAVIGRKGVGKKHIIKAAASISDIQIVETLAQAILLSIKNIDCILLDSLKSQQTTKFEILNECTQDQELQKFLEINQKQQFRTMLMNKDSNQIQSTQAIQKIKKHIKHILIVQKQNYLKICERYREINNFSVCVIEEWPSQAIISVYRTEDQYSQVHAQIFTSSNSVLIENGTHALSMKKYQKYINLYTQIFKKKNNKWKYQLQNYQKIYDKFNESCSIIRKWQGRVQILKEQITESIEDLSKSIEVNKLQSFVMSVLTKQLHQKQEFSIKKNEELQKVKKQMEIELNTTKKIMQKIEKIINSLNRTQMSELKKIYKSNKIVTFGLQCICILFKEEVNEKSINKLLADSNLLMKMKGVQILNSRNHYFQTKFKKQSASLQQLLKTGTTQTVKILIDWIKAIIQYWETNQVYSNKIIQYKKLKQIYENSIQEFQKINSDLKNIQERAINMNKSVGQLQKKKIQTEQELTMISTKLQNSGTIIPILLEAEEEIQKIIRKKKIDVNNLLGNSILFAFISVFLPLKRLSLKQKLLQTIKKHLKQNFIAYSQTFIGDITESKIDNFQSNESKLNSLQDMNMFLLQECSGSKLIIDPERKVKNYLQDINKEQLKDNIIEDLENITQFQKNCLYLTSSQSFANQIVDQEILIIDWKIVALNPQEKLFNKIAFSKKREYFEKKHYLNDQIQKNLKMLDEMKVQLYNKICKDEIKILEDQNFITIGEELVKLQDETKQIQKKMSLIIQQIQQLSLIIYNEVNQIFLILGHLKQIRPVGLDLILDAASKQGNSIQNVISWALANLEEKYRLGWLIAITYSFKQSSGGQNYIQLMKQFILQLPLNNNQVKIKKPSLVSIGNWQKIQKLSTYTACYKVILQNIQKHPKQFQNWIYDQSTTIPKTILPQNISFMQQLFFIWQFKQKVFPFSIQSILQTYLQYEMIPYTNQQVIQNTNKIFPIISHISIEKIQYLCSVINQSKLVKIRIGSIEKDSQMRNAIWKAMEDQQWMIIYGITDFNDVQWIQKIVYYTMNYKTEHKMRFFIQLDARKSKDQPNTDQILLNSSKYLSSIGVHIYQEQTSFLQLYQNFKIQKVSTTIEENNSSFFNLDNNKNMSQIISKQEEKKNQLELPKQFLLNRTFSNLNSPRSPKTPNQLYKNLLNKLHKHIVLAHRVVLKRYPQLNSTSRSTLNRIMKILQYISQYSIPVQFNVQTIALYIQKIYSFSCSQEERKRIQQLVQRIVDQSKFNDKNIYGINVSNEPSFNINIDKQIESNNQIMGCDDSYALRIQTKRLRNARQTLDLLYSSQNIKEVAIQIRTAFSRLPIILSNKQIKNQNYRSVFEKEQDQHNKKIVQAKQFFEWVDVYANKDQIGENIETDIIFDWENLLKRFTVLINKKQMVKRNQFLPQLFKFINNLKNQHEYLLYLNPSLTSFSLDGSYINNFSIFVSSYLVNYLSNNNIRDAFCYIPTFQFKKTTNQNEIFASEGLILTNLNYRDFRFNTQLKTIDQSLQIDGQQKAPIIVFKMKKKTFSQKQQEEPILKLCIRHLSNNIQIYSLDFSCFSVFLEWNLRQGCLFTRQ